MNIVVLAGGTSTEREISLVSGTQVTKALRLKGNNARLLDVFIGDDSIDRNDPLTWFAGESEPTADADRYRTFSDQISSIRKERKVKREGFFGPGVLEICKASDAVFMALHGANGEDGKIQAAFELLDIPYTGCSYLGSALAMDKAQSKILFRYHHVPTPRGISIRAGEELVSPSKNGVGLPCVVKPCCGGSSVGVTVARTEEEYEQAVLEGFRYEDNLVVEQFIEGREFSVGVVDGKAYPVIEIAPISGFYDYHNKYNAGSTVETCPADLPDEVAARMQKIAVRAYHALNLNSYGRMDIMMDHDGNIYCLEANTLPGMTPTSLLPQEAAALGMSFADLCERLVEVSLSR